MANKSVEQIDAEIEALKEKRRQRILADRTSRQAGAEDIQSVLGFEVFHLFEDWTSIDPQLFRLFVEEHADEIVKTCSTPTELYDAINRTRDFRKERAKEIREEAKAKRKAEKAAREAAKESEKQEEVETETSDSEDVVVNTNVAMDTEHTEDSAEVEQQNNPASFFSSFNGE